MSSNCCLARRTTARELRPAMDHQHDAIDHGRKNRRVGKGNRRRRVDDDMREALAQPVPSSFRISSEPSNSAGFGGTGPEVKQLQIRLPLARLNQPFDIRVAGKQVSQTYRIRYVEIGV